MARSGDVLEHPVTREQVVWRKVVRDTKGELLQFDLYVGPRGFVAAEHVHVRQEERFEVLAGALRLRVDGKERTVRAGEGAAVERLLADVSLGGNKLVRTAGFLGKGRRLAPRLQPEASRRGQPVPRVRLPQDFR